VHGQSRHTQSDEADALARRLIGDLHTPKPAIFWADLLACALVGWSAFAYVALAPTWSILVAPAFVLAVIALYRGVSFTHELSHIRPRVLPGFETTWNLLFGVPLLLPSFAYVGVHQSHHNLATYGTKDDPEYLPFASSRALMIGFGVQSALLAAAAAARPFSGAGPAWAARAVVPPLARDARVLLCNESSLSATGVL
jgi:fatty acid desaturase